jgi:hypothetical protein
MTADELKQALETLKQVCYRAGELDASEYSDGDALLDDDVAAAEAAVLAIFEAREANQEERLGKWLVAHQGQATWEQLPEGARIYLRGWYPNGREYGWWAYSMEKKPTGTLLLLIWLELADYLDNVPKPEEMPCLTTS